MTIVYPSSKVGGYTTLEWNVDSIAVVRNDAQRKPNEGESVIVKVKYIGGEVIEFVGQAEHVSKVVYVAMFYHKSSIDAKVAHVACAGTADLTYLRYVVLPAAAKEDSPIEYKTELLDAVNRIPNEMQSSVKIMSLIDKLDNYVNSMRS